MCVRVHVPYYVPIPAVLVWLYDCLFPPSLYLPIRSVGLNLFFVMTSSITHAMYNQCLPNPNSNPNLNFDVPLLRRPPILNASIYTYKYVRRRTTERQSLVSLFVSWLRWLVATGRVTQCMLRSILGVTMWAHEWVGARKNFKILIFFEFCHNAVYTVYIYSKDRVCTKDLAVGE